MICLSYGKNAGIVEFVAYFVVDSIKFGVIAHNTVCIGKCQSAGTSKWFKLRKHGKILGGCISRVG